MQSEASYNTSFELGIEGDSIDVSRKAAKTGRRESAKSLRLFQEQRQGKAAACGHSVLANAAPTTKCWDCWHLFFSLNVKQTYASFQFLQEGREAELVAVHGKKFVAQFKHFVTHVQSIAPIQAEDAVAVGGGE
jgi:hypothetical protein